MGMRTICSRRPARMLLEYRTQVALICKAHVCCDVCQRHVCPQKQLLCFVDSDPPDEVRERLSHLIMKEAAEIASGVAGYLCKFPEGEAPSVMSMYIGYDSAERAEMCSARWNGKDELRKAADDP